MNKGKKKQRKHLCSIHLPPHTSQKQQCQQACDLKYQVQENLEQCFVNWEEFPEAEQQEILEHEIKLAEEALGRAEAEAYLASMASLDPSQQPSSSVLPPTNPREKEMTKEELHQAIGALLQLMMDLTDCVMALTNQVTFLATNSATAAATPAHTKSKDTVK